MKGVQPASLLRLLYLLYNMNCRGLNPATRRHLSQKTVRGQSMEKNSSIDDWIDLWIKHATNFLEKIITN